MASPRMHRRGPGFPGLRLGLGLGLGMAGWLHGAVAPMPRLDSISTVFLQRGTTNRVTLNGDGLGLLDKLWASHEGVRVVPVASASGAVALEGSAGGIEVKASEPSKARMVDLVLGPDVPLGAHEVRVSGPGGVSNPVSFQVSDHAEIAEPSGTAAAPSATRWPGRCPRSRCSRPRRSPTRNGWRCSRRSGRPTPPRRPEDRRGA